MIPLVITTSNKPAVLPDNWSERFILRTKGSKSTASANSGICSPGCLVFSSMAVSGTWTVSVTLIAPLPVASDAGENVAVNPAGKPESEKATAAGMVVPPVGLIGKV